MAKNFYEIAMEHSNGVITKTFLVQARNPLSAVKKAKRVAYSDFFRPIGKVLSIKEVTITNLRGE